MSLIVAAIALSLSAAPVPDDPMCFHHIGLQGKPMPEFCVATSAPESAPDHPHAVIVVAPATLDEIHRLCNQDQVDHGVTGAGYYEWTIDAHRTHGIVAPPTMRVIAAMLREDAASHGTAVDDVITRLERRLSPSP